MNKSVLLLASLILLFLLPIIAQSAEDTEPSEADKSEENSAQVLQSFTQDGSKDSEIVAIDDRTKRIVMFSMGFPLLLLLLATGALGVAMGIYGKQVFVAHMICAGLSITLAAAHAIVGIVWFYPF